MNDSATILVVDDTEANIDILVDLLGEYDIVVALDGESAIQIANEESIDMILLDIMMPGMDGYEVCRILKQNEKTKDIPIIFLTAKTEVMDEAMGLELGAVDYISKPFSPPIILHRVRNHLLLKHAQDTLKHKNGYLEDEVKRRTKQVTAVQDVMIVAMASLAETRDNETGDHIRRTQCYVRVLAEYLKKTPKYSEVIDDRTVEMLYKTAPLHDIGKIGIPDHILLKPGKLDEAEFEIMKTHATLGYDAICRAERCMTDIEDSFLQFAREIAYGHHEKWDGSGYPQGLAGEEIPLSARIMAVADVYDALISNRVYKAGMPHEKAAMIILEGRGGHFDPEIVDAFDALQSAFRDIAARHSGHT